MSIELKDISTDFVKPQNPICIQFRGKKSCEIFLTHEMMKHDNNWRSSIHTTIDESTSVCERANDSRKRFVGVSLIGFLVHF